MSNSFSRFCYLKDLPGGLHMVRRKQVYRSPRFGKNPILSTPFTHTDNLHAFQETV